MKDAVGRVAILLCAVAGVTAVVSGLGGALLGASVGRSVASGLYVVGCLLMVLGVFSGVRGPLRPGREGDEEEGHPGGALFGLASLGRGVRHATGEERSDAVATAWLLLGLGLALVVLGAAVDPRASLLP